MVSLGLCLSVFFFPLSHSIFSSFLFLNYLWACTFSLLQQGGFGGAGFAVGGDLQSTNERLQKQINDKQTMIDQMLQADSVRSRKMDEERRELIGLRSQAADSGGREARLKAEHAAAIENYTFEAKQLRTQLTAKDARVESMRQAHGDATQQLNTRMVEVRRNTLFGTLDSFSAAQRVVQPVPRVSCYIYS